MTLYYFLKVAISPISQFITVQILWGLSIEIYSPLLSLAKMFVEIPAIWMRSVLFLIPFSLKRVQSLLESTFMIIEHYSTL